MSARFNQALAAPEDLAAADPSVIPQEVISLAQAMIRVHSRIHFAPENKGLQLYFPCPACLQEDGIKEVNSRHASINVDRYRFLGRFINLRGTYNSDSVSCSCMKCRTRFKVSELLMMPTLEERGIPNVKPTEKIEVRTRHLIDDGNGNMIPDHPGLVVPLNTLPPNHPAVEYLRNRNYDIDDMVRRFRASYCYQEAPEDKALHRWYKKMPGGFKDTPQGRIVFYADINGVQVAWQARIIDKVEADSLHWYWHPYEGRWVLVRMAVGVTPEGKPKWQLVAPFNADVPVWKPSKYRTAQDASRNQIVFGLDAALEWNREHGLENNRIGVLGEGPLDAARFGPGMAMLGKFLSDNQAQLLAKYFKRVIWIGDNDPVGVQCSIKVRETLAPLVSYGEIKVPEPFKDAGELAPAVAQELFDAAVRNLSTC